LRNFFQRLILPLTAVVIGINFGSLASSIDQNSLFLFIMAFERPKDTQVNICPVNTWAKHDRQDHVQTPSRSHRSTFPQTLAT
jgi:hypothetical protein